MGLDVNCKWTELWGPSSWLFDTWSHWQVETFFHNTIPCSVPSHQVSIRYCFSIYSATETAADSGSCEMWPLCLTTKWTRQKHTRAMKIPKLLGFEKQDVFRNSKPQGSSWVIWTRSQGGHLIQWHKKTRMTSLDKSHASRWQSRVPQYSLYKKGKMKTNTLYACITLTNCLCLFHVWGINNLPCKSFSKIF